MAITQAIGEQGFHWFLGIVEQIDEDPKQLGRVKIRVLHDDDDAPADELDWAHVLMPTTSAGVEGVSDTPSLSVGSRVVGFYLDGSEKQQPVIMSTFNAIPDNDASKHSLSWLARGKNILLKDKIGPEPDSAYEAQYPYNRVIQTKSGNVIELDDTPGSTRIHIYHNSGAYVEINNDGRIVIKSPTDTIDVCGGVRTVYAKKDVDIIAENNVTIAAKKGIKLAAAGGVTITEGSLMVKGAISSGVGVSGTFTTPTGKVIEILNGIVVNIS